ncbi:putative metallopeptidase [Actinacidiphila reveromycinica]|uniref:Aminopeptidase N n=1 Tax=Actinacidiphila reveromycinica TaxID=659352 RepID=A0A7U3VS89_9ACTN|nr:M1 family metallopeptidase [Streptomyces sp. SN-593]BBB01631.1 putative metallopeptidase [Streptomyces sp. SN-593]
MRLRPPPPRAVTLPLLAGCLLACCLSCTGTDGSAPADTGAPGVGDRLFPDAGNGGYDVGRYTLDLDYDPASGRLRGTATLTATADQDLERFDLDLAGMEVSRVTVDGATARATRAGTELRISPAHRLRRGARFTTTVAYQGVPRTLTDPDGSHEGWFRTDDGALALGEPVGSMAWFPGDDHPSDKAAFDVTVTVPRGLTAVSGGEPVGTRPAAGGRTSYQWRSTAPMATYLATVAIGHFDVTRSTTPDGLPLYVAVDPRSDDAATAAALARIPEILSWEQGLFGPYPFASAGAVVDHLPKGRVGYALETQTRPVFPGDGPPPAVDQVTLAHELAHQWFGDSVTPSAWQDMWLNEGFATFTEWLWKAREGGPSLDASAAAALADPAAWAFPPASPPDAAAVSAAPAYGRGALVLYELRRTLGAAVFGRLLKQWAAAHRHGNASTADFTAFCARLTSRDLRPLFATWLYGAARPAHL